MTNMAISKIREEYEGGKKLSRCGAAVGKSVVEALELFCRQSREFAQAVVNCSKPVGDCIESTVRKCGASIPDIEVYRRAAAFYFPGAKVHMEMTIDLGDGGYSGDQENGATAGGGAGGMSGGSGGAVGGDDAAVAGSGDIDDRKAAAGDGCGNMLGGSGSGSAEADCDGVGDSGHIDVSGAGSSAAGSDGTGSSSKGGLQSIAPARIRLSLDDLL